MAERKERNDDAGGGARVARGQASFPRLRTPATRPLPCEEQFPGRVQGVA